MTIYCTKALEKFFGAQNIRIVEDHPANPLGDWNAHLFNIKHQKNIILVNNKSYYAVLILEIKKPMIKDFSTIFIQRLTEQLMFDKVISPDEVLLTVQKTVPVTLAGTNNDKRTIGTMNEFIYQYRFSHLYPSWENRDIKEKNAILNDHLVRSREGKSRNYWRPVERMKEILDSK
jgi:hypothetical protein